MRGNIDLRTYMYSYMHMFTRIYLCREDSAAVQRSVEVECPTRQVTQEDTACVVSRLHAYTRPYLTFQPGIGAERQERRPVSYTHLTLPPN